MGMPQPALACSADRRHASSLGTSQPLSVSRPFNHHRQNERLLDLACRMVKLSSLNLFAWWSTVHHPRLNPRCFSHTFQTRLKNGIWMFTCSIFFTSFLLDRRKPIFLGSKNNNKKKVDFQTAHECDTFDRRDLLGSAV